MYVGACKFTLRIPASHSLKEKRKIIRSLSDRIRHQFNVAIAEIDDNDQWQLATLGFSCVSNNANYLESLLSKVMNFVSENATEFEMIHQTKDIIPFE